MVAGDKNEASSFSLYCLTKCFQKPVTSTLAEKGQDQPEGMHGKGLSDSKKVTQKKPGGWKSMPFILGNETFERLATFGLLANFTVYLVKQLSLEQVVAVNIMNIWSGITNFAPLLGAFVSDAYVGRFKTIAFSSFASLLGMMTVTLTAWLPQLHPPKCNAGQQSLGQCKSASKTQLGVLLMGLCFLSIGTGGIRPCSIPFGVDQFDPTTEEGVKGITSFFNWYYTTFTVVILFTLTVVVYIQTSVSWVLGFGIPTILMVCSIVLFFIGTKLYVYVEPEGSIFSGIAQVLVSAYKKRKLKVPEGEFDEIDFYDPPLKATVLSKLPLTNQFRFLNKAAMIVDDKELNSDGSPTNHWRLCSIQQVEEVKCLIKIIPIWASGIICFTSITQQGTFTVLQALKMDRHLGPNFQIPAGSISIISMLTIGIWLPIYDRLIVPSLRKVTKHDGGITLLQRIGIGIVFSVLSMVVAGLIEKERRAAANSHPNPLGIAPVSVMWLAPQLILMGFCEAFNIIGQIEFFNQQFPDHMRSIANSLISCSFGGASYLSSLLVTVVHAVTGSHSHPDWLTNDINAGRLDYFYYVIAGMGVVNFIYFLYCAHRYRYKGSVQVEDQKTFHDLELVQSTTK
ncbi:protein NRT1/ PTR FAMILY 2.13-like [Pistacia vera]|uniref:protein NRT1/ PTR FAMILY 2.13-like n=1 Tax=Pistacia vera TaxID=55513 RepID=UPI001263AE41|nr:protein NRT1/ PTR FAMILY 2.13-like [Pistacia vera]XP_031275514.1 protein NRT1/ PTR FAMILY 2.13-like [Pistacia vera]